MNSKPTLLIMQPHIGFLSTALESEYTVLCAWVDAPETQMREVQALIVAGESALPNRADESNRGLISADIITAVGPDGLLVNVARGQLVDEDALIDALRAGHLGAAALDVFAEEPTVPARWADVPNVLLTPHTAGATDAVLPEMTALLKANLGAFFTGARLPTPVP